MIRKNELKQFLCHTPYRPSDCRIWLLKSTAGRPRSARPDLPSRTNRRLITSYPLYRGAGSDFITMHCNILISFYIQAIHDIPLYISMICWYHCPAKEIEPSPGSWHNVVRQNARILKILLTIDEQYFSLAGVD